MVNANSLEEVKSLVANKKNWVVLDDKENVLVVEVMYKDKLTSIYYDYDTLNYAKRRVYYYVSDILGEANISGTYIYKKDLVKDLMREMDSW